MTTAKTKIRDFLTNDLGLDLSGISDESELFTSGVIDSFALIETLAFLESEFKCSIDIGNLSIDDLDTIESMVALTKSN